MFGLSFVIALSAVSVCVPIKDTNNFSILENQNLEYYEKIKEEIYNRVSQESRLNIQDDEKYYEISETAFKNTFGSDLLNDSRSGESNQVKCIRIAMNLSSRDGLGSLALSAISAEANGANEDSTSWVDSGFITSIYKDCARHLLWNFRSIKNVLANTEETRIFTVNYEWANALFDYFNDEYGWRYRSYISEGHTESEADSLALADAYWVVWRMRGEYAGYSMQSYSFFQTVFNDSNIMDFHNNYVGRDVTGEISGWGSRAKKKAFTTAKNRGLLIVTENSVTESHRLDIYNNTEYWWRGDTIYGS